MKKQYSKPGIIIEDFRVAEHIASCTGVKHNNWWGSPHYGHPKTCEWTGPDGIKIFAVSSVCTTQSIEEDTEHPGTFGSFCYNGPSGVMSVFSS